MNFKVKDYYYKKAKSEKFLARSVYKLEEIDQKYKIFKNAKQVLDLGYAPGAWCQYSLQKSQKGTNVVGIDIKDINLNLSSMHKNLTLLKKDIFDCDDITFFDVEKQFDIVLSDMAPNTTGIKMVDQQGSLELVEKVFNILDLVLEANGSMVIKVFDSQDAQKYIKSQKSLFKNYNLFKPKATRDISKEFYVIGQGYKK